MKISIELKIFRNESIQKSKYHHDGRLLGLLRPFGSSIQFLAYRGVVYISNEAKRLNILIGEKFSLNFYNKLPLCKPEIGFKNQTGAKALATDHRAG